MKRFISIMAAMLVLFVLGAANAQGVTYAETTEYSFDDDVVTGDLVRPDGELTTVRKSGRTKSLIRVRTDFVREMLKSVENL